MKSDILALRALGLVMVSVLGVVLLASCEHDKEGNEVYTPLSPTASQPSGSSRNPTTGHWTGTSGPGRQSSSLTLNENEGAVSGTLKWPNQTMSVTGTHSGALVRVQISCGDTWNMSYNGSELSGTGQQESGDTYGIKFKRK
jgi:hypothetical protein